MTDTSPAAVERAIRHTKNRGLGKSADIIADLAAQLEAANQRHAAALEAVNWARDAALVEASLAIANTNEVNKTRMERLILALRTQAPEPAHPDDTAVDRFATSMKAKLKYSREEKGRGGWNDTPAEALSLLLREHVDKGDPLDVGNFAMMLHQRGDKIEPARVTVQEAEIISLQSDQGIARVSFPQSQMNALRAEVERLREALAWYGEQARLARIIHSEGDKGRNALASDGGKMARIARGEQ